MKKRIFFLLMWSWMIMAQTFSADLDALDPLLQALRPGNAEEAQSILEAMPGTISDEARRAILGALERLSPSGEWIPFLKRLAERYGPDGDLTFHIARSYWRAGVDESAIQTCEQAYQEEPNNPDLVYRLAALAHTVNRVDLAQRWLNHMLELDPNQPDGLFLLGRIEASLGHDEEAKALLTRAIEHDPTHYLAFYELGRLENRANRNEEAEKALRAAIHYYPFFREAYNALMVTLARQNKVEENKYYRAIVEHLNRWTDDKENRMRFAYRNPAQIAPMEGYELAVELYTVGRRDLARAFLERALLENQSNDPQKFLLAQLRFREKDYSGCLGLVRQIQDARITTNEAYAEVLAWSLYLSGAVEESVKTLQATITQFPQSKQLQRLAETLQKKSVSSEGQIAAATTVSATAISPFLFADVTEKVGLYAFRHTIGHRDKRWITDAMGSGVAVGDYDNDGDDDIYFVNARPDLTAPDPTTRNALFRNDGGTFTDVTEAAGVGDLGYGMCALFGDVNNDGWQDLFVGNLGANALYLNQGDGTFREATQEAGVGNAGYAAAAAFGDVDGDGDLDLFVGNYIQFDPDKHGSSRGMYHGIPVFSGPLVFQNQKDLLYINDGQGHFTDRSESAKINVSEGRAMGAVLFDMDQDRDLDLYVTNDGTYNHVLRNQGDGTFEDVSFASGGAFNESGVEGASMGISLGDYNNDGFVDLYITAYEQQPDVIFKNDGKGILLDVSGPAGITATSRMLITWGSGFCDFDADGRLDVYTANGHIYPQIEGLGLNRHYNQGITLYHNLGEKFIEATANSFMEGYQPRACRGSALIDFDGDGDMDIVINCIDGHPQLLENRSPHGHWLQVKLDAPSARTFGVRVVTESGENRWTREVDGGSSYLSQNSHTLHFGLGDVEHIDRLTVYWMHRPPQVVESPLIDTKVTIKPEGR